MNRAYSILAVKAVDDDQRTIRGIASTPTPDRMDDIIEPLGIEFSNPAPLLWQHMSDQPVGTTEFSKPTKNGMAFEAMLPLPSVSENLIARISEAWESVKLGLVRAVSIGFRPLEWSFMENGGVRYSKIEVLELSLVTIPANSEAVISVIKSIDQGLRVAAGVPDPENPVNPKSNAASGKNARVVRLVNPARDRAEPYVIRSIKR